jgi:tRNA(Phe) wybutosine-synthesizing methylase Tyw3
VPSLLYSDDAEEMLMMCVERLETTTNELEKCLITNDELRILNRELIQTVSERDERLRRIENSLNSLESATQKEILRNRLLGFGIGVLTGGLIIAIVN